MRNKIPAIIFFLMIFATISGIVYIDSTATDETIKKVNIGVSKYKNEGIDSSAMICVSILDKNLKKGDTCTWVYIGAIDTYKIANFMKDHGMASYFTVSLKNELAIQDVLEKHLPNTYYATPDWVDYYSSGKDFLYMIMWVFLGFFTLVAIGTSGPGRI